MKDLPHAGLPEKESTVPGTYGQCRTQIARGDIGATWVLHCPYYSDHDCTIIAIANTKSQS